MARLRATASAARSVLDGREHGGTLGRVGIRSTPIQPSKSAHARPSKTEITLTVLQTEVEKEAKANDIAMKTLRRAKKALQVDSRKDAPDGASWRWHPP